MASTLKLEIVTPEAKIYSEDVEMVTLPGVEGEMGIYPMHVPLMTQIVAGELAVRKDGREYFLAIGEGFVEITADKVAIMTAPSRSTKPKPRKPANAPNPACRKSSPTRKRRWSAPR